LARRQRSFTHVVARAIANAAQQSYGIDRGDDARGASLSATIRPMLPTLVVTTGPQAIAMHERLPERTHRSA